MSTPREPDGTGEWPSSTPPPIEPEPYSPMPPVDQPQPYTPMPDAGQPQSYGLMAPTGQPMPYAPLPPAGQVGPPGPTPYPQPASGYSDVYGPAGQPAGYSAAYPAGYPPQPRPTNGMAVASLVLGILGWIYLIPAILALIFGYIARSQIKQRGEAGDGMAIAGIVLGWFWVGILVLVLAIALIVGISTGFR